MVVAIGVAVAALRGMTGWLADRRQRFQDEAPVREAAAKAKAEKIKAGAEHSAAMRRIRATAAEAQEKAAVQSPTDFGRDRRRGEVRTSSSGSASGGRSTKPEQHKQHKPLVPLQQKQPKPQSPAPPQKQLKPLLPLQQKQPKPQAPLQKQLKPQDKPKPQDKQLKPRKPSGKTADAARAADARRDAKQGAAKAETKKPGGLDRLRRTAKTDSAGSRTNANTTKRGDGQLGGGSEKKTGGLRRLRLKKTGTGAQKEAGTARGPKLNLTKDTPKTKTRNSGGGGAKGPSPHSAHTPGGQTGKRPWKGRSAPHNRPGGHKAGKGKSGGPRARSGPSGAGHATGAGFGMPGSRSRQNRSRREPPPQTPRPDGEWLSPPPGMTATYSVNLTRTDKRRPPPAGIGRGRQGLAAGTAAPTPGASTTKPQNPTPGPGKGAHPMGGASPAVPTTQFADADLTVYDVIDSDADMAEEVLLGAEHTRLVARHCERLVASLEQLQAELIARQVPGSLIGWCASLIDRAAVIETKAEELSAGLPRAAEAIAHAGQVAAEYDQQPADVTRDMGHTAPADASYHKD